MSSKRCGSIGILETVDLVITAKVGRARECRLGPTQLEDALRDSRMRPAGSTTTAVTMTQTGFPSAELRNEHGRGVPNAFTRFERVVRANN